MRQDQKDHLILFDYARPRSFIKAAMGCIISESLDQLYILRDLIGQSNVQFSEEVVEYQSLNSRYGFYYLLSKFLLRYFDLVSLTRISMKNTSTRIILL